MTITVNNSTSLEPWQLQASPGNIITFLVFPNLVAFSTYSGFPSLVLFDYIFSFCSALSSQACYRSAEKSYSHHVNFDNDELDVMGSSVCIYLERF